VLGSAHCSGATASFQVCVHLREEGRVELWPVALFWEPELSMVEFGVEESVSGSACLLVLRLSVADLALVRQRAW
jgi:hypothetical protein